MSFLQAIILAIFQGATEFLPVSSSGHLRLIAALFGWKDLPPEYFRVLTDALQQARVYETAALTHLGAVKSPEAIAEIADVLLQAEGVEWVLCTGGFREEVYFSLRMRNASGSAGELARTIVEGLGRGGGHEEMAGGRAKPVTGDLAELHEELKRRFLAELAISPEAARPLY